MQLLLTARFQRAYAALSLEDQKQVQKALRRMSEDLRHPGLGVKRIRGTKGIWEARGSRALRITFETKGESIILRNVGRHDEALGSP
jgi:mRNA-degrading endonuclease RelE of RelBE toxin-antitoxin system